MKLLLKLRFSSLSQELPYLILAMLFRFVGFLALKVFRLFYIYRLTLNVPDEGFNSYPSCELTWTSQFLSIPLTNVLTYILANQVPAFTVST